jgi:hypothetical protein
MTKDLHRTGKRAAPSGAWLAFLAIAVQILLPFLVAYEIALVSSPAYADRDAAICSASGTHSAPTSHTKPGLCDQCPLCGAMAATQGFTTAIPVAVPLPRTTGSIVFDVATASHATHFAAASYNSRAPPTVS